MERFKRNFIIAILIVLILGIFLITRTTIGIFKDNQTEKKQVESKMDEVYGASHIDIHDTTNSRIRNGEKYSTAAPIKQEHYLNEEYEISDMKIYTKDGWCYIEFMLTNTGDSKCNDNNCSLHLTFYKDSARKEYLNFAMIPIPKIEKNETKKIVSQQIQDFTVAYDYVMDY